MTLPNYDAWLTTNISQEYWDRAWEHWCEHEAPNDYERAIDNNEVPLSAPDVLETLDEWMHSAWGERYFEAWEESQRQRRD